MKRAILTELVAYVTYNRGIITEPVYPAAVKMVGGWWRRWKGGKGGGRVVKEVGGW